MNTSARKLMTPQNAFVKMVTGHFNVSVLRACGLTITNQVEVGAGPGTGRTPPSPARSRGAFRSVVGTGLQCAPRWELSS